MGEGKAIRNVVVVGGGSAGFMAALALKVKIPQLNVTVIRSKAIGVIGVGEGSGPPFMLFLHGFLKLPMQDLVRATRPSWKLGTCFLWGPRKQFFFPLGPHMEVQAKGLQRPNGFYCDADMDGASPLSAMMAANRPFSRNEKNEPAPHQHFAYHIENERFSAYLETAAVAAGVNVVDQTIRDVQCDEQGVKALLMESGERVRGDLYVDSSGFPSLLLGKALGEPLIDYRSTLACDRAVVGGWERSANEPINAYTTAETMDSGWCWRIDLPDRINRGYVFSSAFIDDDAAEREFRQKNPRVGATRVLRFVSGRRERSWVKNVVAIGNASGFVEPLEATSLTVIATRSQLLAELLIDADLFPGEPLARLFNEHTARVWDGIRRFLSLHYRFNTRLDTPFWRHCREKTDMAGAEGFVEYYKQTGPSVYLSQALLDPYDVWGPNGYLTILVGQRVPTHHPFKPSAQELSVWQAACAANRATAAKGMTVKEVLAHMLKINSVAHAPAVRTMAMS